MTGCHEAQEGVMPDRREGEEAWGLVVGRTDRGIRD
ncbi:hypothetical protein EES45_32880 [Streptomyces sp. ADI97-07]|nr:hypothetical protein EES45_32880 [Streptomyces sp. ADI97-07]